MSAASTPARPAIVTGAGGFVGAHVMRALLVSGRRVVATDIAAQPNVAALVGLRAPALTYVAGDLREPSTLAALRDAVGEPADVVHVAARIQLAQLGQTLGQSAATPSAAQLSLDVNATASWRLCTTLLDAGLVGRFVHVSTRSVFGGRPPTETKIGEDERPQPAGIYGSSKAAAEHGLLALREQFGIDLAVARITGVFGPWQGPASFIGQAMEAVLASRAHRTERGGDDAYELTYVKDTVRGLMSLVDAERLRHPVYHVASGDRLVRLAEVADAYTSADPTVDVHFGPGANPASQGRTPLDTTRMRTELGFETRWSITDAVADYLRVERTGEYGDDAVEPRENEGP